MDLKHSRHVPQVGSTQLLSQMVDMFVWTNKRWGQCGKWRIVWLSEDPKPEDQSNACHAVVIDCSSQALREQGSCANLLTAKWVKVHGLLLVSFHSSPFPHQTRRQLQTCRRQCLSPGMEDDQPGTGIIWITASLQTQSQGLGVGPGNDVM